MRANFRYSPFGEVIEAQGTVPGSLTRRFNDKHQDAVSELHYYGLRYYDPLSLTWTQADPLFRFVPDLAKQSTPRRAHLYEFSLNNPVRYIDPDGANPAPVPVPESPQTLQQRALASRIADEDWTIKFAEVPAGTYSSPNLFDTSCQPPSCYNDVHQDNFDDPNATMAMQTIDPQYRDYWFQDPGWIVKGPALIIGIVAVGLELGVGEGIAIGRGAATTTATTGEAITADTVQNAVANSCMLSQQTTVSLPVVENYVQRLLGGEVAPAIRVAGNVIVDGVHRYVAGSIVGQLPATMEWAAPMSANLYPVCKLGVDVVDWGNR